MLRKWNIHVIRTLMVLYLHMWNYICVRYWSLLQGPQITMRSVDFIDPDTCLITGQSSSIHSCPKCSESFWDCPLGSNSYTVFTGWIISLLYLNLHLAFLLHITVKSNSLLRVSCKTPSEMAPVTIATPPTSSLIILSLSQSLFLAIPGTHQSHFFRAFVLSVLSASTACLILQGWLLLVT